MIKKAQAGLVHRYLFWALAFCLTGIGIRIILIFLFPDLGQGEMLDSTRYLRVVTNIFRGRLFSEYIRPTAFAPPLYPYFIAGVFAIFGKSILAVKLVQALLGGVICWLIFRLGSDLYDLRVGLLACFITAIYPELIVLAGYLYTETVYITLLYVSLLLLIRAFILKSKPGLWILSGVILGLSVLTRHILLAFPLFLLFVICMIRPARIYFRHVLIFLAACYLTVAPWIVRNYIAFNEFIPVAIGAGGGVWIGSHLAHNGEYRYEESRELAREASKETNDIIEKDRILFRKAFQNIVRNPFGFGLVFLKKFIRFFVGVYEHIPDGQHGANRGYIRFLLGLSYYPVFLFFLLGVVMSRKIWLQLLPLCSMIFYTSAVYSVTIVVPRYRIPLLPAFFVFAAFGCVTLWDRLRHRTDKHEKPRLKEDAV